MLAGAFACDNHTVKVFSFGGGVQSVAALVLAGEGEYDCSRFIFCDVGEDSENPGTIEYMRDVAMPYAASHGISLETVQKILRTGQQETVLGRLESSKRSIPIPVRMSNTGAPGRRSCTVDFKVKLVERWVKRQGATPASPWTVALGISTDEIERARTDTGIACELREYPLLDRHMSRADCVDRITAAGLPVPPKSACWFCPMRSKKGWAEMSYRDPETFERVAKLEEMLQARRVELGKDPVYFHRSLVPLRMAVNGYQPELFEGDLDGCESGYCST